MPRKYLAKPGVLVIGEVLNSEPNPHALSDNGI
jgi:hypothetical protein